MTTYGVTDTGFVYPSLDDIVAQIGASLQASLGNTINLIAPSVFSQLVGIQAEREFAAWQAAAAVYASQYPATAEKQALDNVATITGALRLQATYGTVTLTVNLGAGVTLPAGSIASSGPNTAQWQTLGDVANDGGTAADVTALAQCTVTGAIQALASTITTIVTPYAGWNTVTNVSAATVGRAIETDAAFRLRRASDLSGQGMSTVNALYSALSNIVGVVQASVFNNPTGVTDANGVPPHAVECVVYADHALDSLVRETIWDNLPAGIQAYGADTGTIVDSQGFTQEVDFSHPTEEPVYAIIHLSKTGTYGGDALVSSNVANFIQALAVGASVYEAQLYAPVFAAGGVLDIAELWISLSNPPTGPGSITLTPRQKATCLSSQVTVVST